MVTKIDKHIGKLVKKKREEFGLSQSEIAYTLGFKNHQSVLNIEKGIQSVSATQLYLLCRLFNLDYKDALPPIKAAGIVKRKNQLVIQKKTVKSLFKISGMPKI